MTLADLMHYRLIIGERHAGVRRILERKLAEKGYTLEHFPSRYEVGSLSAVKGWPAATAVLHSYMKNQFTKNWLREGSDASPLRIFP